jgi:hypothetical protein
MKDVQAKGKVLSLKSEHPALQNVKFLNFLSIFGVIFALLDPDPESES